MWTRSVWRVVVPLMLAVGQHQVEGQTPAAQLPALFVTRLQEPPAGQATAREAGSRSAGLPPLPATTLETRQPDANLDGPRRVSLTVARPMPLSDLLLLLVNGTPFSLVDGGAASGATFVGDLKDLTMRQAIEAVLFPRALDYDVQGTLIRVFPRRTSTRLFTVNYPNTRRTLTRDVAGAASSTTATDFLDELDKGVQALLSPSGRMHVDRTAGIVQVTDFTDRLDQVGIYIEAVQLRAARQVRIEAQVFEVALADGGASSIDWGAPAIRSATSRRPANDAGSTNVGATNIEALKQAIAQQGTIMPIAAPQVLAMNNEPAIMRFGEVVGGSDSPARQHGEGLTLTVVAQISADRIVQMHVSPSYASPARGSASPEVRINETDTVVRVQDGETIVLSGFSSGREKPLAVEATGNQVAPAARSELVILLTPTIVRSAGLRN